MSEIQFTPEQLISKYIETREAKKVLVAAHDAEVKELEELLDIIEQALLVQMKESEMTSVKTTTGLAIRMTQTRYTLFDRGLFAEYLRETGNLDLIELRPAQKATADLLAAKGVLPPGVTSNSKFTITVRENKAKPKDLS
jgi:hypothetical protein